MSDLWLRALTEECIRRALMQAGKRSYEETPNGVRRAAVLLPMFRANEEWHLLYIRRSEHLQDHRGQVAFPGGGQEARDQSLQETALREAEEEIGVHPADVRLLGSMDEFLTISNFLVTPFVGVIPWPYGLRISQDEVAQVFHVPLRWLDAPGNFSIRPTELRGQTMDVIYYEPYEGQILWGITALITVRLLKILRDFNHCD